MLLSESVNLLPDKTVFIQLAIFLMVAAALNILVFKPVLKILRLRKQRTGGEKEKLEELNQKTENLIKEYEGKIGEAKHEGFKIKEAIRKAGEAQAQKLVQEAKKRSSEELEKMREEIEKEALVSSKKLEEEAQLFSQTLAEKVLGRVTNPRKLN